MPEDELSPLKARGASEAILNVRSRVEHRRGGRTAGLLVWTGRTVARPVFFVALAALHVLWVVVNVPGWVPWAPFDPPPFVALATIASVEAPFLALLVLIRQERDRQIAELREETALQVAFHAEREATAQLRLLVAVAKRVGIERFDEIEGFDLREHLDFDGMQRPLDPEELVEETERQLEESGEELP